MDKKSERENREFVKSINLVMKELRMENENLFREKRKIVKLMNRRKSILNKLKEVKIRYTIENG
jgi:hypothetical protein